MTTDVLDREDFLDSHRALAVCARTGRCLDGARLKTRGHIPRGRKCLCEGCPLGDRRGQRGRVHRHALERYDEKDGPQCVAHEIPPTPTLNAIGPCGVLMRSAARIGKLQTIGGEYEANCTADLG